MCYCFPTVTFFLDQPQIPWMFWSVGSRKDTYFAGGELGRTDPTPFPIFPSTIARDGSPSQMRREAELRSRPWPPYQEGEQSKEFRLQPYVRLTFADCMWWDKLLCVLDNTPECVWKAATSLQDGWLSKYGNVGLPGGKQNAHISGHLIIKLSCPIMLFQGNLEQNTPKSKCVDYWSKVKNNIP